MQQRFLLQILLLAQHVSGNTMPIIRSSSVLYSGCCLWYFVLWFSSCWSGVELRSAAARLLRSWVRIQPGAWMFVSCECCVLSGRGLFAGMITRPEESYRLWRVVVCDLETSKTRRLKPATGL